MIKKIKYIFIFSLVVTFLLFPFGFLNASENDLNLENTKEEEVYYSYFGFYPQTVVNDSLLYDDLYFLSDDYLVPNFPFCYEYNGKYYVKYRTGNIDSDVCFNNGTLILSNRYYFFELEPVLWKVYDLREKVYYSDKIIDFDTYTNYINECNEIYNKIELFDNSSLKLKDFSVNQKSIYQNIDKYNSTNKIQLLDYEMLNNLKDKRAELTDYALAKGANKINIEGINYGDYWTCSLGTNSNYMMYVRINGEYLYNKNISDYSGIRLVIRGV